MKEKVTFVLTSCGRVDLLDPTLESFFTKNSYRLDDLFLVEDSVDLNVYKHVEKKWGKKLKLFFNKNKKGQIQSIVDTYLEKLKSLETEVVKTDKKIIQVWLESKESASRLDIFSYGPLNKIKGSNIGFRKVFCKPGWEWGYFSFRPGVKRMKDYKLIGGYERFKNELDIGVEYKKNGFYTVIIENPAVEDIGLDRTIIDPTRKWPKRRKTNAPKGLKRLWKHIKKMKF